MAFTPDHTSLTVERKTLFSEALDTLATKVEADEMQCGVLFPQLTAPNGQWVLLPASLSAGYAGDNWSHGNWFCGFWVGLLFVAWLHTGEARYLTWARERMRLVAQRADDGNTHDIGFIFDSSAVVGHHITGDAWYAAHALKAADRLRARLVNVRTGAYLASWGPLSDPRGRSASAIDTMANLSLLYWASQYADDGSYQLAAQAHATLTASSFIRPDGSTYHAVEYDLPSGRRKRGYTFQGAFDESCWSRGQAWAIYGYVNTARATGDPQWLALAERLADHYLMRLGDRHIPPWDFDAHGETATVKDTAAAAIVSSALIALSDVHPDQAAASRWYARGVAMLEALCVSELLRDDAQRGLLGNACYSMPHREGVQSATMFGDFYFAEALCRVMLPGALRQRADALIP